MLGGNGVEKYAAGKRTNQGGTKPGLKLWNSGNVGDRETPRTVNRDPVRIGFGAGSWTKRSTRFGSMGRGRIEPCNFAWKHDYDELTRTNRPVSRNRPVHKNLEKWSKETGWTRCN